MKESIKTAHISGVRIPKFKGHTKIILTDVKTGKQEIHEKDNMVTDAIVRLFANNYANSIDISDSRITPIRNLFGGVMCFGNQLTENQNNCFPPDEDTNPLIAHAGNNMDLSHTNPKLGVLSDESGEVTNGYQWIWDFGTSRGNGTIAALGLCSGTGGNVGLTPTDDDFSPIIVADNYKLQFASNVPQYFDTDWSFVKYYPIRYNSAKGCFYACYLENESSTSNPTFHELEIRHDVNLFGLNISPNDWVGLGEDHAIIDRTVELTRSLGWSGAVGYQWEVVTDGSKYYLLTKIGSKTSSGSSIHGNYAYQLWTIDPSGTDLSATASVIDLYEVDGVGQVGEVPFYDSNSSKTLIRRYPGRLGGIPIHNGYLYVPDANYATFYKIQLSNPANVTRLANDYGATPNTFEPAYWVDDICYGYNYIINGDAIYPIATTPKPTTISNANDYYHHFLRIAQSPTIFDTIKRNTSGTAAGYQLSPVNGNYLATIQNLTQAITKSSSQSMKIIYTLTEVRS